MVMNDEGQLYTIEGITAGIIMLLTAYVVFSTGFVFTPGDAHIADMQLQQLGYDALLVMDTPVYDGEESALQTLIMDNNQSGFKNEFNALLQKGTGTTFMSDPSGFVIDERTQWNATIYYHRDSGTDTLRSYSFGNSDEGDDFVTREPAISVTRYVYLDGRPVLLDPPHNNEMNNRKQMVLLEVLLWRG
jgi:hypothetical protein